MVFRIIPFLFLLLVICPGLSHSSCRVSTTPITFAGYDIFQPSPTDSTGTVTVFCTENPPDVVTVSIGPSPNSGGFYPRRMRHAMLPDQLDYNLYTKSNRAVIWGDGTGTTSTESRRVNRNVPWNSTVYGRIPALQDVPAGQYFETLTITITW